MFLIPSGILAIFSSFLGLSKVGSRPSDSLRSRSAPGSSAATVGAEAPSRGRGPLWRRKSQSWADFSGIWWVGIWKPRDKTEENGEKLMERCRWTMTNYDFTREQPRFWRKFMGNWSTQAMIPSLASKIWTEPPNNSISPAQKKLVWQPTL